MENTIKNYFREDELINLQEIKSQGHGTSSITVPVVVSGQILSDYYLP